MKRDQVRLAAGHGMSTRKACALIKTARSTLGYQSKIEIRDRLLLEQIRPLAEANPRFGYRRIFHLLLRAGVEVGIKRFSRVWRTHGLSLPKRRPRRKIARTGIRRPAAVSRNSVWAYDFVHDGCANGQPLKCLTVVDEFTRECLAIQVEGQIRSQGVIDVLSRLMSVHGVPMFIRSDNGPEFISRAVKDWLTRVGAQTAYIEPGKPWQNGTEESFNGKFRDECLNMEWFSNRTQARILIEQFRRHYNEARPHSSLAYKTPAEFAAGKPIQIVHPGTGASEQEAPTFYL